MTRYQDINTDYEIMIVGGGPAGISTWLHLHKYAPELAEKTLLIEKEKYPRDKVCGGAILDWGQYILKKLGIEIEVPNVAINKAIYRYDNQEYCHKVKNFLKIIHRPEFDQFLANKAIDRGLEIHQNEEFVNYMSSNKELKVRTNRGEYNNIKVLIGADGALSKVRQKMNLSTKLRFATGIELIAPANQKYDLEFSENSSLMDFTYLQEGLQGYVWHFPCLKQDKPFMNHGICHTRIIPDKQKINVKDIFKKELEARNIFKSSSQWQGAPVPWSDDYSKISKPNVILVGDAAGIDALIGGGIHLSLAYGKLATTTIIDAFQNNDFTFSDYSNRFMNDSVGKYITRLTYLAKEIYSKKLNVTGILKKLLNQEKI